MRIPVIINRFNQKIISIRTANRLMQDKAANDWNEYSSVINYGVECMQQGQFRQARLAFLKAIRDIDCYCYIGYYNMFVIECFRLDTCGRPGSDKQIEQSSQTKASIMQYLYLALSCLYQQLGKLTSDAKLCTKSLALSESNSQAYLTRASVFEQEDKLTLAQNDYSSAVYYAPLNEAYYFVMKRAQFYWRIGKIDEANQDVKLYWQAKMKEENIEGTELKSKPITEENIDNFQTVVAERSVQLADLLDRLRSIKGSTIENSTFRAPKSPKNLFLIEKQIQSTLKQRNRSTAETPQLNNLNLEPELNIENIIEQQTNSNKPEQKNKYQEQQGIEQQDQPYLDQSSKNISQQIERLQNQIKIARGRMSIYQSQSQSHSQGELSNQINLLSAEIELTSKDIQNMKKLQLTSNNKFSNKTNDAIPIMANTSQIIPIRSHTITQHKTQNEIMEEKQFISSQNAKQSGQEQAGTQVQSQQKQEEQKEMRIVSRLSTSSANSKYSQKFIALEQLQNYTKIIIQIVSAQFFDSNNKQQCKVYLNYGNQRGQTEYSKNNFWRHKFMFAIEHQLHKAFQSQLENFQDSDLLDSGQIETKTNYSHAGEINVELEMKSKSIWSSKRIIGRGSINLQRAGEHKCILSNESQKTGIVYFKIKLQ